MAVFWFDPTSGSSGNTGLTSGSPKQTLAQCETLAVLGRGDIAVCKAGTHTISAGNSTAFQSFTAKLVGVYGENAYLTPSNPQPSTCTIDFALNYYPAIGIQTANQTITVSGIKFSRTAHAGLAGILYTQAANAQMAVRNCVFDRFTVAAGFKFITSGLSGSIIDIRGCVFQEMLSPGSIVGDYSNASNWVCNLYNNTFFFDSSLAAALAITGTASSAAATFRIKNNVIENAIASTMALAQTSVANCTLDMQNNVYYCSAGGTINLTTTSGAGSFVGTPANNITSNPLFYDKAGRDFRILPASTIHDLGTIIA